MENIIKEGEVLFAEGKIEEAEKCFLNLLENDPQNVAILNNLGVIYHTQDNTKKAEDSFLRALIAKEDNLDALLNLSELYQKDERWEDTAIQLEKCIAIDKYDFNLLNRFAMVHLEMGDFEKAQAALIASLDLNPDQGAVRNSLSNIEYQNDQNKRPVIGDCDDLCQTIERIQNNGCSDTNTLDGVLEVEDRKLCSIAERQKQTDVYYEDLWNKPGWSSPHPNDDEMARWTKISNFLENITKVMHNNHDRPIKILDVGCGRGWMTNLANRYGVCEGLDPVAGAIKIAQKLFPHIYFHCSTVETLLKKADFVPYDIVLNSEVIEHVSKYQKSHFIKELRKLLKPDGFLILTTPRKEVFELMKKHGLEEQPVEDWLSEDELSSLFANNGFKPMGCERIYLSLPKGSFVLDPPSEVIESKDFFGIYQIWTFQVDISLYSQSMKRNIVSIPKKNHGISNEHNVSIVIPCYNHTDFLKDCLNSLTTQTYSNWEAIVVDDNSVDGEPEEVVKYFKDKRIKIVRHEENKGLAAARNTGFKLAQGNLLLSVDADDMLEPGFLHKVITAINESSDANCVFTDFQLFGTKNKRWCNQVKNPEAMTIAQWIPGSGTLMRRTMWESAGGYCEASELRFGNEDWDFWLAAAAININAVHIPEALYLYRQHPMSMRNNLRYYDYQTREFMYERHNSLFKSFGTGEKFLIQGYINSAREAWLRNERLRAAFLVEQGRKLLHDQTRLFTNINCDEDISKQILQALDQNPNLYNQFGTICLEMGNIEKARIAQKKAIELNPDQENVRDSLKELEKKKSPSMDCKRGIKKGEALFAEGKAEEAERCFLEIVKHDSKNAEAYNNLGVIALQRQNIEQALEYFTKSLEIDPVYKCAVLNYSEILRIQDRLHIIIPLLEKGIEKHPNDRELSQLLREAHLVQRPLTKIAFLCLPGLQSFLVDIVDYLKTKYDVRTCYSNNNQEIEAAIQWADLIWLEWADELTVALTNHPTLLDGKRVICRLHSHEALAGYAEKIKWERICDLIFVAEHSKDIVLQQIPDLLNRVNNVHIVPSGVCLDRLRFKDRASGTNLAFFGHINYKNESILLLHAFRELIQVDGKYHLFIGENFQDDRYKLYFGQMIKEMGLEKNIHMDGLIEDARSWLDDKHYIVCTGVLEGHPIGFMEAMACGLRPVIHNFIGANRIFPEKYLWNTIPEFVHRVTEENYDSLEYRRFIEKNYSRDTQLERIGNILNTSAPLKVFSSCSRTPLVSVLIATHNRASMIGDLFYNLQDQTYKKYEIVVVNDCSTDNTDEEIQRWMESGHKIRYIKNQINIGGAASFDRAFSLSKGDYVLLLSDDDQLRPDAIEKMVAAACRESAEIVYCDLDLIDVSGKSVGRWSYEYYQDYRNLLTQLIMSGVNRIPETPLLSRNAFEGYRKTYSERLIPTYYIMNLRKMRFAYVPEPLYKYRVHINSQACDKKGFWQRNKAVINFMNTIAFMYSFQEIFPTNSWQKSRQSLAGGYTALSKILYNMGGKFINGEYYNGLRYEEKDGFFILFYKYAHVWLKKALRYGARGTEIENLQGALSKFQHHFEDSGFFNNIFVPEAYVKLPDLALLAKSKYETFVALDVLVLGNEEIIGELLVGREGDKKIVVKFHHVSKTENTELLKDFLRSNLIHVVIAKSCEDGCMALKILDELQFFSIPVIVFASSNDSDQIEKMQKTIEGTLSPVMLQCDFDSERDVFLGVKGLTEKLLLKRIKEAFEI